MNLLAFLRGIRSDPSDPSSMPLLVVEDDVTPQVEAIIHGGQYKRRPYAVVLGLPGNAEQRLHNETVIMTSVIDVVILQPATEAGVRPGRGVITSVWEEAKKAPAFVTSIPHYDLVHRFHLITEVKPGPRDSDPTSLTATARFRARYAIAS